jgi:hypothetical protein
MAGRKCVVAKAILNHSSGFAPIITGDSLATKGLTARKFRAIIRPRGKQAILIGFGKKPRKKL